MRNGSDKVVNDVVGEVREGNGEGNGECLKHKIFYDVNAF